MKQTLPGGLTLAILLTACAAQNATINITPDAWRADLRYLAAELPGRHANAFHTITRERFDDEVAKLDEAIPRLTNEERVVGLMRIVALIGDGHTHLDLPHSFPRYPIELHWFGDELRVVAAGAPYHAVLGARVIAVGNVPLADLMKRTTELVPRGETEGRTRETAAMQLTSPEVLHGLGVIADRERAPFVLENSAGERNTLTLSPAPIGDFSSWRMAGAQTPPLYLRNLGQPWWTEFLPETKAVYFSFTGYPPEAEFRERATALAKLLDDSRARRLVIDLRRNQGGDFQRFRALLLPIIEARPAINRAGGLFVIIGPGTFSAAGVSALDLRNRAHAILVGAPAGIRPNHYGDSAEFRLPNSGLRISYATQFHRFGAETDSEIAPDKSIQPTWEDFRTGRDPVMEWILSYPQGNVKIGIRLSPEGGDRNTERPDVLECGGKRSATPLWIRNHDLSRLIESAVDASLCRRTPNLLCDRIPPLSLGVMCICVIRVYPQPISFSRKIYCKPHANRDTSRSSGADSRLNRKIQGYPSHSNRIEG